MLSTVQTVPTNDLRVGDFITGAAGNNSLLAGSTIVAIDRTNGRTIATVEFHGRTRRHIVRTATLTVVRPENNVII